MVASQYVTWWGTLYISPRGAYLTWPNKICIRVGTSAIAGAARSCPGTHPEISLTRSHSYPMYAPVTQPPLTGAARPFACSFTYHLSACQPSIHYPVAFSLIHLSLFRPFAQPPFAPSPLCPSARQLFTLRRRVSLPTMFSAELSYCIPAISRKSRVQLPFSREIAVN